MTHVPYGYKIQDEVAFLDEPTANAVKKLFEAFNNGNSMSSAAAIAGINKTHSAIGRILQNEVYLGTDFYPQIISKEVFLSAQDKRAANSKKLNRMNRQSIHAQVPVSFAFTIGAVEKKYSDPYEQAQYAYSLIEEENNEG